MFSGHGGALACFPIQAQAREGRRDVAGHGEAEVAQGAAQGRAHDDADGVAGLEVGDVHGLFLGKKNKHAHGGW